MREGAGVALQQAAALARSREEAAEQANRVDAEAVPRSAVGK